MSGHRTADGELAAVELEAIRLNAADLADRTDELLRPVCPDPACRTCLLQVELAAFLRGLAAS